MHLWSFLRRHLCNDTFLKSHDIYLMKKKIYDKFWTTGIISKPNYVPSFELIWHKNIFGLESKKWLTFFLPLMTVFLIICRCQVILNVCIPNASFQTYVFWNLQYCGYLRRLELVSKEFKSLWGDCMFIPADWGS